MARPEASMPSLRLLIMNCKSLILSAEPRLEPHRRSIATADDASMDELFLISRLLLRREQQHRDLHFSSSFLNSNLLRVHPHPRAGTFSPGRRRLIAVWNNFHQICSPCNCARWALQTTSAGGGPIRPNCAHCRAHPRLVLFPYWTSWIHRLGLDSFGQDPPTPAPNQHTAQIPSHQNPPKKPAYVTSLLSPFPPISVLGPCIIAPTRYHVLS